MTCQITTEINIHCDEPEQLSASEILNKLLKGDMLFIGSEFFELSEITDKIDIEDMREAIQDDVMGDNSAVIQAYLKVILELMK